MRRLALLCAALMLLVSLSPIRADDPPTATPAAALPDPNALTNSVTYWDVGIALNYPASWRAPLFINGQMLLGADPSAALSGTLEQPIVALRIIDPVEELGLPKGSDLTEIAIALNLTLGDSLIVEESALGTLAGLDAGFAEVENPERGLYGQSFAFLLPDGRYAALSGISRGDQWANFVTVFAEIRASARLLSARDVSALPLGDGVVTFEAGAVQFRLPQDWQAEPIANKLTAYRTAESALYADDSALANGAMLVLGTQDALPQGQTFNQTVRMLLGLDDSALLSAEQIGGRPALRHETFDPISAQHIAFIAVQRTPDQITVIRWSAPLLFYRAYQPIFRAILQSVRFTD
ncbi:MAG: hypothetical protein DYG88_07025 [Chloroflexi bacterium CFX4]|nr:hypothetical protein [Chloroflexi bacterium CFX4]MDL1922036.1 hypothetical protein [Chloroflexi bacterium CFX3]